MSRNFAQPSKSDLVSTVRNTPFGCLARDFFDPRNMREPIYTRYEPTTAVPAASVHAELPGSTSLGACREYSFDLPAATPACALPCA